MHFLVPYIHKLCIISLYYAVPFVSYVVNNTVFSRKKHRKYEIIVGQFIIKTKFVGLHVRSLGVCCHLACLELSTKWAPKCRAHNSNLHMFTLQMLCSNLSCLSWIISRHSFRLLFIPVASPFWDFYAFSRQIIFIVGLSIPERSQLIWTMSLQANSEAHHSIWYDYAIIL